MIFSVNCLVYKCQKIVKKWPSHFPVCFLLSGFFSPTASKQSTIHLHIKTLKLRKVLQFYKRKWLEWLIHWQNKCWLMFFCLTASTVLLCIVYLVGMSFTSTANVIIYCVQTRAAINTQANGVFLSINLTISLTINWLMVWSKTCKKKIITHHSFPSSKVLSFILLSCQMSETVRLFFSFHKWQSKVFYV